MSTNTLKEVQYYLPYGEKQGSFMGVVACSNRDDSFFSGESNYVDYVIYTGYRYQCVEYARRFLLLTTGCVFGSCGRASEIFNMNTITHVETGTTYDFIKHINGNSKRRPTPGDIIVYPYHKEFFPWGHVGVISYVDNTKVGIAEQNHTFTTFTSPDPNYLDGERCISRYIDLIQTKDGNWKIKENPKEGVDCLGWMSYPNTPKRLLIHQLFQPLPEQTSVRATPVESENHPSLWRFLIKNNSTTINSLYIFKNGSGEALTSATTAFTRIIRVTLQFLFRPNYLSSGFLALPNNPLGAELVEISKELNDVITSYLILENNNNVDAIMNRSLSNYFGLSIEVIEAMRREFNLSQTHMLANITFCFNLAKEFAQQLESGIKVDVLKAGNPHDETWLAEKVDFGTPKILNDLAIVGEIKDICREFLFNTISPKINCFMSCECRVDFSRYVKNIERERGTRSGFTIIKSSLSLFNNNVDEIIERIILFCDSFKYPANIVDESQVFYDSNNSKLYAYTVTGNNKIHVDFCLCITEWPDIIAAHNNNNNNSESAVKLTGRAALCQAALDPKSDVVFAKPLWSLLCSGRIHPSSSKDKNKSKSENKSKEIEEMAVKFFNISRRLYECASPKQPPEVWERDVHEFKDSCRRCHLINNNSDNNNNNSDNNNSDKVVRGEAVVVNFSASCCTGREPNGNIAGLMHMFS